MKRITIISTLLLLAVFFNAGANDKKAAKFKVNTDKSKVNWVGTKPAGEHNGFVKLKGGNLEINDGVPVSGTFVIDMKSIVNLDLESETWNTKLVDHLKSEDFFYVEKHPTATYTFNKVEALGNGKYKLMGELTLKDITKPVTLISTLNLTGSKLEAKTETVSIDRTQWKVEAMSKTIFSDLKDKYVDDEMQINVELFADAE